MEARAEEVAMLVTRVFIEWVVVQERSSNLATMDVTVVGARTL